MKYIELEVKKLAIQKVNDTTPISGSKNYFGLSIAFDSEFENLSGAKVVEFFKNRNKARVDIVDGKCKIPNEFLEDKNYFEIRVLSGNTIATPWIAINITESGTILPEEVEELPEEYEYVKTISGEGAAVLLRETENGLEYSTDGINWKRALNGVPDVPKNSDGKRYVRAYGDWVEIEDRENGGASGDENVIEKVQVNGTELEVTDKTVNIDLSDYIKTVDAVTQGDIDDLQTLQGESQTVTELSNDETDTAVIVAKINELIGVLKERGIVN